MSLIHIQNLTKHFKILNRREGLSGAFKDLFSGDFRTVKAVDGISFDIDAGEIVGYIGPNGAGKSTTIKMMTGILKPTDGTILLVYSGTQLNVDWTFTRIALLLMTLFSASLVQISMTVSAACAAFWVIDSYPVLGLAWKLREFSPYPMSIFDGAFRFAFTYIIPIGFVAFYPSQLFLRPGEVTPLIYFSPLIGIGLFAIAYWIWTKGVNSYTGTGS